MDLAEWLERAQLRAEFFPLGGLEKSPAFLGGLRNLASSVDAAVALVDSATISRSTGLLEFGMLLGSVGAERLIVVGVGSVTPPMDISGLRWISAERIDERTSRRVAEAVGAVVAAPPLSGTRGTSPISCFISYTRDDREFVEKLAVDLAQAGFAPWTDAQIEIGRSWRDEIHRGLSRSEVFLPVLSRNSIRSHWVNEEIGRALAAESTEMVQTVYPLRLDDAAIVNAGGPVGQLARTFDVLSFENWREDESYRRSLRRLVQNLVVGAAVGGRR